MTLDYINFRGRVYGRSGERWLASRGRQADMNAQGSIPIFECLKGTLGADGNSVPYEAVIAGGDAKHGGLRDVGGASCRDYEINIPTPHDVTEREFRFSMCINERDHLPRETRRTPPGSSHEGVSTYTQWNAWAEAPLPPGFPN